jgi:hypothetical protein
LKKIYDLTVSEKKWIGSDIWRFFKNDVADYCITSSPDMSYRNILVILTDGYIYHNDSKDRIQNRYAYITPSVLEAHHLRNNPNWEKTIDSADFGLIAKRNDLNNLEILVLEVNPSANHKNDEDIIKKVLSKWFDEMKVKRYRIYNTELPVNTIERIDRFFNESH